MGRCITGAKNVHGVRFQSCGLDNYLRKHACDMHTHTLLANQARVDRTRRYADHMTEYTNANIYML